MYIIDNMTEPKATKAMRLLKAVETLTSLIQEEPKFKSRAKARVQAMALLLSTVEYGKVAYVPLDIEIKYICSCNK